MQRHLNQGVCNICLFLRKTEKYFPHFGKLVVSEPLVSSSSKLRTKKFGGHEWPRTSADGCLGGYLSGMIHKGTVGGLDFHGSVRGEWRGVGVGGMHRMPCGSIGSLAICFARSPSFCCGLGNARAGRRRNWNASCAGHHKSTHGDIRQNLNECTRFNGHIDLKSMFEVVFNSDDRLEFICWERYWNTCTHGFPIFRVVLKRDSTVCEIDSHYDVKTELRYIKQAGCLCCVTDTAVSGSGRW